MQASIAASLALLGSAHGPAPTDAREPVLLLVLEPDVPDKSYGTALASIGDVDRDGLGDVAVGAPGSDAAAGRVYLHSGAGGRLLRVLEGESPGDGFGTTIVSRGDLDGDGLPELWISAPGASGGANGRRLATIEPVRIVPLSERADFRKLLLALPADRELALAVLGDLTGDGADELAIGLPARAARGETRGRVEIWSVAPR